MATIVDESGGRTLASSAATAAWVGFVPVLATVVGCYSLAEVMSSGAPFRWWPVWGEQLRIDYPWFIAIAVTATVAFLAADLGGQIVRGDSPTTKSSRRAQRALTAAALGLWGVTPLMVLFILVNVLVQNQHVAVLLAVVPTAGLQFFLTARVGTLLIPDLRQELASAKFAVVSARATVSATSRRSRRPVIGVLAVDTLALSMGGGLALAPYWSRPLDALLASVAAFEVALPSVLLVFIVQIVALANPDWSFRLMVRLIGGIVSAPGLLIAFYAFQASTDGVNRTGFACWLAIWATTVLLALVPPRILPTWVSDWTIGGAATKVANRTAVRRRRKSEGEYARLLAIVSRRRPAPARVGLSTAELVEVLRRTNAPRRWHW